MISKFVFSQLAYLASAISSGSGLEIHEGFNINLTLVDSETIKFDIVMKPNTWLGLSLGDLELEAGGDFVRFIAAG